MKNPFKKMILFVLSQANDCHYLSALMVERMQLDDTGNTLHLIYKPYHVV